MAPKKTIQNAINTAQSGDTVQVADGIYQENLEINKNITIIGTSQKGTIIDGKKQRIV
jgi:pectin methylesterase-like acyl-CoA thioesterase